MGFKLLQLFFIRQQPQIAKPRIRLQNNLFQQSKQMISKPLNRVSAEQIGIVFERKRKIGLRIDHFYGQIKFTSGIDQRISAKAKTSRLPMILNPDILHHKQDIEQRIAVHFA
ncbi:hypothetical protein D3C86_975260 [compost metagenome]